MANRPCKICNINVSLGTWMSHVHNPKHLSKTPGAIMIKGSFTSDNVKELNDYLSRFGIIESYKITTEDDRTAVEYVFKNTVSHSVIIHCDHSIFDQELEVSWATKKFKSNNSAPGRVLTKIPLGGSTETAPSSSKITADPEAVKKALLASIKEPPTFAEQIQLLQKQLQVGKAEIEQNRNIIYDDLNLALSQTYNSYDICFFGSSITGLDVQGSDLDVYIDNVRPVTKPEVAVLKTIRFLIFKSRKFCDVLLISGAKTPIIKCIHTKTQICCDINVKNRLSVRNSELIKYYLTLDAKIKPLMIFVKFWADLYGLKKVNFFSSYALYMMVIYYLQQPPYSVPTVLTLQRNAPPEIVDIWNCGFDEIDFTSPALEKTTILDLLVGFFRFYGHFDYVSNVIAPFYGAIIDKASFLKPHDLPRCYHTYMSQSVALAVNSGVCIQDPFEHSRNVSASVPLQCIGRFTNMCRMAEKLTQNGETELLYKLLTTRTEPVFSFEINKVSEKSDQEWINLVREITMKFLSRVLNLKVSETLMNASPDVTYNASGQQNIWDNRINIYKNLTQLPSNTSEIDKEIAVTECILKYFPQNLNTSLILQLKFKENPTRVEVSVKQMGKCKQFFHIYHYIKVKLVKFINLAAQHPEAGPESVMVQTTQPSISTCSIENYPDKQVEAVENQEGVDNNETSTKPVKEVEEEEEEDVPADFFDDFSNQDFMDGLDIVDAWDEASKPVTTDPPIDIKVEKLERKHSPIRFSPTERKSSEKRKKLARSRSRTPTRRYHTSWKRSRSRDRIRERRDPEKTKRDINRDKIKCARDRELKIVSDKLKIVETGLVPPGTEMDFDVGTVLPEKRRSNTGSKTRYVSRRSSSRETRKRYSRSPVYRPSRIRSRKRTSSIESGVSERELWIRSSRKRTRSRSRDSPRKKREETKKKSFLEEIRDKLNETSTRTVVSVPPVQYTMGYGNAVPVPAPVPVPVPAPTQYFPQTQYDQNFFIGDSFQMNRPPQNFNMMPNQGNVMPIPQRQIGQVAPIQPGIIATPTPPPPPAIVDNNTNVQEIDKKTTDDIDKLFADKKISLSDFLTITAKCEVQSSNPDHLQKKIKVISRCQDAIKVMSDERKFTGRLLVKSSPMEQINKNDVKYQSPLRRIPVVRFQFTTPSKTIEGMDGFSVAVDKILKSVGIVKESISNEVIETGQKSQNSSFADEDTAALTLKATMLGAKKEVSCDECKKRKQKTFVEVGSQCADNKETCAVGIQVNEEELTPTKVVKNESIAFLTPAQLLGKNKESDKNKESPTSPQKVEKKTPEVKKKPQPSPRGRGGFRKGGPPARNNERPFYEEKFDYYENPSFGHRRYGGPSRFPQQHYEEEAEQYEEEEEGDEFYGDYTDFNHQPFQGRQRFGPRF
ncbi:uncharacterized protein mkg-p [Tribolium castaneum]|uniref:Uncharacterized protein n=1 Tax=Tribolium castaneum TaxID=7070 RepID=D2A1V4_TRICA|nr:PREDICTED: uncharacterized protein LOC103312529 [Tribolium castaneum]EFA02081.2 hypothetical protein TcasGA2_TC007716 [Tribolium castaneum]|eukprot:XP_008191588.1 PREDICTED: uncharacterized protein LOC103312529 [Tribolium castaneum]